MIRERYSITNFDSTMPINHPAYKIADRAYQYATDMTQKELQQAVEGMYHNLK